MRDTISFLPSTTLAVIRQRRERRPKVKRILLLNLLSVRTSLLTMVLSQVVFQWFTFSEVHTGLLKRVLARTFYDEQESRYFGDSRAF